MKLIFSMILMTVISGLTACASKALPPQEIQHIDKIAIVSALDDQMNKVTLGMTVFDNDIAHMTVNDLKINQSIENDLAQKLWATGKETVILPLTIADIMKGKNKIETHQKAYKNAELLLVVTPINQSDNYPKVPEGYGVIERNILGFKQKTLYASILYEIYSTKDGTRKAYYLVHPEGDNLFKLTSENKKIIQSGFYTLFDKLDTDALRNMGF